MKKYKLDKQVFLCYNYSVLKRARSPVDRTLASGAESGSSTLPERTSKARISIVHEILRCLIVSIIEGTR